MENNTEVTDVNTNETEYTGLSIESDDIIISDQDDFITDVDTGMLINTN